MLFIAVVNFHPYKPQLKIEMNVFMVVNSNLTNFNKKNALSIFQKGTLQLNQTSKLSKLATNAKSINADTFKKANSAEETGIYSTSSVKENSAVPYAVGGTTPAPKIENIPYSLAAKRAGLSVYSSTGMPIFNSASDTERFNTQLNNIRNVSKKLSYSSSYCFSQKGYNYGYTNADTSCATFALATAISIRDGKIVTPKEIKTDSDTSGHGTKWGEHGAYKVDATESATFLAIDAQLSLGNPVLIHATGYNSSGEASEHWATVIGKQNGVYTIIDPYDGKEHTLDEMQIYKNRGQIVGYAVVSDLY